MGKEILKQKLMKENLKKILKISKNSKISSLKAIKKKS